MTLSDRDIIGRLDVGVKAYHGELSITPVTPDMIQPASVDLHLGAGIKVFTDWSDNAVNAPMTSDTSYVIAPRTFAIATTLQRVKIPNDLRGVVCGKSTWGRRGLAVEFAGYIDPGFEGTITLELYNFTDRSIILTEGIKIAQISFDQLSFPCEHPYGSEGLGSHYQGQSGTTEPRCG